MDKASGFFFLSSARKPEQRVLIKCALYPDLMGKSGGYDACESRRLAQCLDGADVLCWTQTVNDRWSSFSPLGLCSSSAPLPCVCVCDTVSVTLIVSGSFTVNRPFLWKH